MADQDTNTGNSQHDDEQDAPLSNEELISLVQQQGRRIATLEKMLNAGTQIKLGADKKDKPKIPKDNLQYEGKTYRWKAAQFVIDGEKYTAEEASTDKGVIKKILALKGQGILQELV